MRNKGNDKFELIPQYMIISTAHILVFRIFATALSLLILWMGAEKNDTFFSTLMVFTIGQLLFVVSLKALTTIREILRLVIITGLAGIAFIALGGLLGGIHIVSTEVGYMIAFVKATKIIYLCGSNSFVTFVGMLLIIVYVVEWGTSWFVPTQYEDTGTKEESE